MILSLFLALYVQAKEPAKKVLPYLGPGADKLSAEEYERIYRNYIRASILLGYPVLKEDHPACDRALSAIFRQAGMFTYPVPADAQHIQRSEKRIGQKKVETYENSGMLVQLLRDGSTGAPEQLIWVNQSSTRAARHLSDLAKKEFLTLEKDPVTGLERVKGVPVGYPHPLLSAEGQGLLVRVLEFNRKKEDCQPVDFFDDAWTGGFHIDSARCAELQEDANEVWTGKLSPEDFQRHELRRMKDAAVKNAIASGAKEADAKKAVNAQFVPPFASEINVVGAAMRNLAQCNLLALSRAGVPPKADDQGSGGGATSGTAK